MRRGVSVVIPMYNEVENVADTLDSVADELSGAGWQYQLVPVDDGSTDGTGERLRELAAADSRIAPVSYRKNRGSGYALRQGFARAEMPFVASLDADLSYSPDHVTRMLAMLDTDDSLDIVVGSPYMPGGGVDGVSAYRLAISRAGNMVLEHALSQRIHTTTGILRAYRREVLDSLDLESDDKEIHLEILSKALALGYRIEEMPSVLATRRKGKSSFRLSATVTSHLLFSLLERPTVVFGLFGATMVVAAVVIGAYLLAVFAAGDLNPERPLMTVLVLLFMGGAMAVGFAILATQMLEVRRQLVRLQRDVRISAGRSTPDSSDEPSDSGSSADVGR